ncbi:unnamed protein product [Coccothraustes coccothraustes]
MEGHPWLPDGETPHRRQEPGPPPAAREKRSFNKPCFNTKRKEETVTLRNRRKPSNDQSSNMASQQLEHLPGTGLGQNWSVMTDICLMDLAA